MIADADDAHTPASTPVSELQIPKKNANDAGQSEGSTNAFPRPDLQMQMMQEETMSAPSGATADENIWCMATLGPTRAAKLMVHPPTIHLIAHFSNCSSKSIQLMAAPGTMKIVGCTIQVMEIDHRP